MPRGRLLSARADAKLAAELCCAPAADFVGQPHPVGPATRSMRWSGINHISATST